MNYYIIGRNRKKEIIYQSAISQNFNKLVERVIKLRKEFDLEFRITNYY